MAEKIVVGMSGGVDSSMTMLLLKKQGWDPVGVSLKLSKWDSPLNNHKENICCTEESFCIAKEICDKLDVPYHIYDVKHEFEKEVMGYFLSELKESRTPNPCIMCNRHLKFFQLFRFAKENGIRYVATGHYARIEENKGKGIFELKLPKDMSKDQTYGLCLFPQEYLRYIKLPLGDYLKSEVYGIAEKEGFTVFKKTKQSQDLCFVSGKALKKFIHEKLGEKPGDIVDVKGKVLGKHKGLHFFTIGQKKGLGLPGTYFVKEFDTENNRIIVTKDRDETITETTVLMNFFNFTSDVPIKEPTKVTAKIRYADSLSGEATLHPPKDGILKIVFDKPRHAVTPGQFCVFYKEDICLGGGIISNKGK